MDSEEIKGRLTTDQIKELIEYYNGDVVKETTELIIFTSICHNSNSPKLYYYPSTKTFYCWSQCGGNVDIFSIVMEQENISFEESIKFIEDFFHLDEHVRGFGKKYFTRPKKEIIKKPIDINEKLPVYEETILNTFRNIHPVEWLKEGISEEAMDKYEISYCMNTEAIIIPHRDMEGRLIGVRCRNLDKHSIEERGKYTAYT